MSLAETCNNDVFAKYGWVVGLGDWPLGIEGEEAANMGNKINNFQTQSYQIFLSNECTQSSDYILLMS